MTTDAGKTNEQEQMLCVGVLGGGQLGQMLGDAAKELNLTCVFYETAANPCAASSGKVYTDLASFVAAADIFTYEFENIPPATIAELSRLLESSDNKDKKIFPPTTALEVAADRYKEKSYFAELGIATASWLPIKEEGDLTKAIDEIGLPLILKTTRQGYDGKGQLGLNTPQDLGKAKELLASAAKQRGQGGMTEAECPFIAIAIAEQVVKFQRELSVLAARDQAGKIAYYPIVENVHQHGILYSSSAPASIDPQQQELCYGWMEKLLTSLSYVGLLTLELFDAGGQNIFANEMAPRVHNSGHWTIEGCATSQFSNHIRAVCGMPLGPTDARGHSHMFNLVGNVEDELRKNTENKPNTHLHIYGKEARPGRKLGHLTYCTDNPQELADLARQMSQHGNFVI